MGTRTEFEYIVVGLGGIGSAAAYWLARRAGSEVLGLEQFPFGHDFGSSEDHTRIIRLTYHTPQYVALAHHAFTHWNELLEDAGEPVLTQTGDLLLGPTESAMPATDYVESLRTAGVAFEVLNADEIMYRWPQWRLDADIQGSFQANGGVIEAARATRLHQEQARARGATLLDRTPVSRISPYQDGVEVETSEQTYRCRHLLLTVDAWTNQLLAPLGMSLPLTLTQEQVSYFATPHLQEFTSDRFPVWIWADDPNFYGTPVCGELRGLKAAQDMSGHEVTTESRTFDADPAVVDRVGMFLQRHLPRAFGPVLYSKTCIYTMPPDRDFVIDTLPEYPHISLALGAGHGFKFAGFIGRVLSDLAVDGATKYPIAQFAVDRPILQMANPPKNLLLRREAPEGDSAALAP